MVVSKSYIISLMVVFLLIRSLMPLGFMPDFGKKNFITICSGTHLITVEANRDGSPVSPSEKTDKKATCPFAMISGERHILPISPLMTHAEIPSAIAVNLPTQKVYLHYLYMLTESISPRAPPRLS
jgi:hypothetical protein